MATSCDEGLKLALSVRDLRDSHAAAARESLLRVSVQISRPSLTLAARVMEELRARKSVATPACVA